MQKINLSKLFNTPLSPDAPTKWMRDFGQLNTVTAITPTPDGGTLTAKFQFGPFETSAFAYALSADGKSVTALPSVKLSADEEALGKQKLLELGGAPATPYSAQKP